MYGRNDTLVKHGRLNRQENVVVDLEDPETGHARLVDGYRVDVRVVFYPPDALEDGTRITPRDDA